MADTTAIWRVVSLLPVLALSHSAMGEEGLWRPSQIPAIAARLTAQGLKLDPARLGEWQRLPLGALFEHGAFVSPQGLFITCLHCVIDNFSDQGKSFPDNLVGGFNAHSSGDERAASPATSVFIVDDQRDVTRGMLRGVKRGEAAPDREARMALNRSAILRGCAMGKGRSCRILSDFEGLRFQLQHLLEIQDVRLVYAPSSHVAFLGWRDFVEGTDFLWPSYRADFAFLRAYVGPDGSSAPYDKANVPYRSKSWLKIADGGVREGDFVMALGTPFSTHRLTTAAEASFEWGSLADKRIEDWQFYDALLRAATAGDQILTSRYSYPLFESHAWAQYYKTVQAAAQTTHLDSGKQADEQAFRRWAAHRASRQRYLAALDELKALALADGSDRIQRIGFEAVGRVDSIAAASLIYRWMSERAKSDPDRSPGYQDRDRTSIEKHLAELLGRFDPKVDRQVLEGVLERYRGTDLAGSAVLAEIDTVGLLTAYATNPFGDTSHVQAWLDKAPAEARSTLPFLCFAVALADDEERHDRASAPRRALLQAARSKYAEGLLTYAAAQHRELYPEGDSTLRISFGQVRGQAGAFSQPFSTADELLAKRDGGQMGYELPSELTQRLRDKNYGCYAATSMGLPINFESTVDSAIGSSGSTILDSQGRLVGIIWGFTQESRISEWRYNADYHRTLATDIRYILWTMDTIDGARRVLNEISVPNGCTQ